MTKKHECKIVIINSTIYVLIIMMVIVMIVITILTMIVMVIVIDSYNDSDKLHTDC